MSSLHSFIRDVPKVELHLHLVGSASPHAVADLATKYRGAGIPASVAELAEWFEFTDFNHFIEVYARVSSLVRAGEDIATLIEGSAHDLASQNVCYAEMTVTPYTQIQAGIDYAEIVEGLDEGRSRAKDLGVDFAWIFDIPGEMGQDAADVTVSLAVDSPPAGLVGFGLGGIELGVERADFAWAFDKARAAGLKSVPHAGEADGPSSILAALDALCADRIGHGVRAVEDPNLLQRLVDEQTPLEVCPSSNVCTGVFDSLREQSLPKLLEAGVFVTINTDDPPMFSTTLVDEYHRIASEFNLDLATIAQLVRNGVQASFLDAASKTALMDEITRAEARSALPA
jgi:aminodeoxyfutalosine deaminase